MIDAHTPNNEQLVKLATVKGLNPPATPDAKHQKTFVRLQGLHGHTFDRGYMEGQVRAHEAMLKLFQMEANTGQDPDIRSFAAQTVPAIKEHLSMAQSLIKHGA